MQFIRLENSHSPVFSIWSINNHIADRLSSYASRLYPIINLPVIFFSEVKLFEFKFYR